MRHVRFTIIMKYLSFLGLEQTDLPHVVFQKLGSMYECKYR